MSGKTAAIVVVSLLAWAATAAVAFGESKAAPKIAITAAEPVGGLGIRILQRRKLGLTVGNVTRVLRDMKSAGELGQYAAADDSGQVSVDCSSLAVAVAGHLAAERPEAWQDIDWDEVLLFLERLLELLIKYLPLILDLFV